MGYRFQIFTFFLKTLRSRFFSSTIRLIKKIPKGFWKKTKIQGSPPVLVFKTVLRLKIIKIERKFLRLTTIQLMHSLISKPRKYMLFALLRHACLVYEHVFQAFFGII